MSVSASQSFIEARANLQAESSRILPRIRQKIQPHRHSFIWQMDKGLENSLFGTPIEQAANAVLTPEQVRRIARENGKTYSYACMAVTPKILALSSNIERLSSGSLTLQEELNSFRSLVERLSVLEAVLKNLSTLTNKSSVKTYDDLIEIREVFSKLVVTRFDWSKLQLLDFSEMPLKTDYQHDASETRVDLTATSALSQIDKLQKQGKYKGIRPFYNFCCEFVHPNIGDILATTLEKKTLKTHGGQLAYKTKYAEDPLKTLTNDTDFFVMFSKAYKFGSLLVGEVDEVVIQFANLLNTIKRENRKYSHKVVRKQRALFLRDDYCPCGSGLSIQACVYR